MNQFNLSHDVKRDNPLTVMEPVMKSFEKIRSRFKWITRLALGAAFGAGLVASPALAADKNLWQPNQQQKNGGNFKPGGNGPDIEPTAKVVFTKVGQQLGCKHVRFRIRLAVFGTPGFFDDPTKPWASIITGASQTLTDQLPKGLSWVSVTQSGDIPGPSPFSIQTTVHDKDTLKIAGLKLTPDNKDGLGSNDIREWNVVAIAKIDPAEFPAPKMKVNQAKLAITHAFGVTNANSHNPLLPAPGDWRDGTPTKFQVDLTDCDPDGSPGDDPDGEPCIKLEKGEVECHGAGAIVPFTYKMPVGPELAGTKIELTSLTPGVVVNPPFQIVPAGGGVLEWDLIGAAKGMTIHLLTNNVKQVGPADFYGLATCCTEEIIIDIPEDIPCDEEEIADLLVLKRATTWICDKNGNNCNFDIRVKNVSGTKFEGVIALSEWQIPHRAAITGGPNAPWSCEYKLALGHYICKTGGPVTLNPNEFIDMSLKFTPGNAWPADKIKNCAKLNYGEMGVAPFGNLMNDKACAEICIKGSQLCPDITDEKKPALELRKFYTGTECLVGKFAPGQCWVKYNVIIHNFGEGDYNGPLSIAEDFAVKPDMVEFSPLPPWACATVNGKNFTCTHPPTNIPANGQMILSVKARFDDPTKFQPKVIVNCAKLKEGENGKDKECAEGTLPIDAPVDEGKFDAQIEKTCAPGVLGGLVSCRISIRNNGDKTPTGMLRIFDVARIIGTDQPLVAQDVIPDGPQWQCEGAPASDLVCAIKGEHLTPGTTRTFTAKIKLSMRGKDRYRNCATLQHEARIGGDMKLLGQSCFEGGVDIRVEKKQEGPCSLDEPDCAFAITVQNDGETDFNGKVKFSDALGLDAQGLTVPINSIAPALPCDEAPTSVPFVCEGTLSLNAGESITYVINLDFTGQTKIGPNAKMRNCAAVIAGDIAINGKTNGNKTANNGFADIVGCTTFTFEEEKDQQCQSPLVMNEAGACVCPGSSRWNGRRCVGLDDTPPPVIIPDEPICIPGKGEFRTRDNRCICRKGYIRKGPNLCVPPIRGCTPGPNEYKNRKGDCLCRKGFERNDYGICIKIPTGCKPGPNEFKNSKGQCVCKKGFDRNNYGMCVKIPTGCKPGPNEFKNSKGQCVCKKGFERNKYGMCVKIPTGCKPGPNEYKNSKGQCVCKKGFERNKYGICQKKKVTTPKPVCTNGKLTKTEIGWYCACPNGWKRYALKNGGARCAKVTTAPKPPCINGSLRKTKNGWYCACKKGWLRKPIGKTGGASCQKPQVFKPLKEPNKVFKPKNTIQPKVNTINPKLQIQPKVLKIKPNNQFQ